MTFQRTFALTGLLAFLLAAGMATPAAAHSHLYVTGSVVILAVGEVGADGPGGTNGGVDAADQLALLVAFTYCQDPLGPAGCVAGVANQLIPACGNLALNAGNWDQTLEVIVFLDGGGRGGNANACGELAMPIIGFVSHT